MERGPLLPGQPTAIAILAVFLAVGAAFSGWMWGVPAASSFLMGCLIGALWVVVFWASARLRDLQKPPWSGSVLDHGPRVAKPPAAVVFDDEHTTDRLMGAFCDPGKVTPRRDIDTPDFESLYDWQRRAVKATITEIWEGE